ncbi:MAG TPA: non-ribosomal peptide synthetase, partial [Deltaproteobacteria bacterium]|nr:non-ribosomal peptide synthetase [Deltaproteobacteria bacterium]
MVLMAGWFALLSRTSSASDISVGTPVANRSRAEVQDLVGYFANTIVLRADLKGHPRFVDLIGQVRTLAVGAFAHQELPFESLVESLDPDRDTGRHPLFQHLFVFQNAPMPALEVPGLKIRPMVQKPETAKFDLTLNLEESEGRFDGILEYATDLFDEVTANRLAEHYVRLMTALAADPHQPFADVSLLAPQEEARLRDCTDRDLPPAEGISLVPRRIEEIFRTCPDAPAVVSDAETLTYAELDRRSAAFASALCGPLGLARETPVGLFLERSVDLVVAIVGTLRAGCAYVPLEPEWPDLRVAAVAKSAEPPVVVTTGTLEERAPSAPGRRVLRFEDILLMAHPAPLPEIEPENLAYILFTSGSTGRPKGVGVPHEGLANRLAWMQNAYQLEKGEGVLQKTPFGFDVSVWEFLWPLCVGARLVVAAPGAHRDAVELGRLIQEHEVTTAHFVPSMLDEFVASGALPACQSLRRVVASGEALRKDLVDRFYASGTSAWLENLYGPTEASIDVTAWPCRAGEEEDPPIGHAIEGVEVFVLDPMGVPVPIGVPGELYLGGIQLARGYLGEPGRTAASFVPHPWRPGARLYRTGDRVRWSADGALHFMGRLDDQVKLRGNRIELGEIESVLLAESDVRETCVLVREDLPGGPGLVAYVVGQAEAAALREAVAVRLPAAMVPAYFVFLDRLPLSSNGKLNRRVLPAPDRDAPGAALVELVSQTEQDLAEVWASVLEVAPESIGREDDFFARGGHSLLATRVLAGIRRRYGCDLPLRLIFESPRLRDLAAAVEDQLRRGSEGEVSLEQIPPADRAGALLPSDGQERLWFLDQLRPGSTAYHVPIVLHLTGALDVAALQVAWDTVLERHEVLRTRIVEDAGRPLVEVDGAGDPLRVFDLSDLADELRKSRCEALVREETQQPFDLATGPLVRAMLFRLGDGEWVACWTFHHIVSDAASVGLFLQEIGQHYSTLIDAQVPAAEPLPVQFVDYAQWQRGRMAHGGFEEQRAYWSAQLEELTTLNLPADRVRPGLPDHAGDRIHFELPADLVSDVADLAQSESATPFMVLLAGFNALLARYCDATDITVGSPIANRAHPDVQDLIGFFANTLVLRTQLDGNPEFRQMVQRSRKTALAAFAHQEFPFELLVEELSPERDTTQHPLFQVAFAYQNGPLDTFGLPGLQANPVGLPAQQVKFDLTMSLHERKGVVEGTFEFATDRFDRATAEQMVSAYIRLMKSAVARPQQRLGEISLLDAEEATRLCDDLNATDQDFGPWVSVPERVQAQAEGQPGALAVRDGEVSETYAELDLHARRIATVLQQAGGAVGDVVAVRIERSVAYVNALLGVLYAGMVYLPISPEEPAARTRAILDDAGAHIVLLGGQPDATDLADYTCLQVDAVVDEATPVAEFSHKGARGDALAYTVYTSGSTGQPKGVQVPHQGLTNLALWHQATYRLSPGDRSSLVAHVGFDASVWEVWPTLISGGSLHVAPEEARLDPPALLDWLARAEIHLSFLPTTLAEAVLRDPQPLPTSLRALLTGGDRLGSRAGPDPVCEVVNHYGPTEASVVATSGTVVWTEPGPPSIGRPIANTQVRILDRFGALCPVGVPGEIHLGGRGLARGYTGPAR